METNERSIWKVVDCSMEDLEKILNGLAREGYMALKFIDYDYQNGKFTYVIAYDPVMQTKFLQEAAAGAGKAAMEELMAAVQNAGKSKQDSTGAGK